LFLYKKQQTDKKIIHGINIAVLFNAFDEKRIKNVHIIMHKAVF
jgi:hypothetical protein